MLFYCNIMVKYGTCPVRDVVILQYYGKIRHPSIQGCSYISVLWENPAPVQSGMLFYCSFMVKYGTRPVRDVDILQFYGKIRHPSSQGCSYISVLWENPAPVQSGMLIYGNIMIKFGTRPVRDVDIWQYYDKMRHPSSQGCWYIAVLW